MIAPFSTSTTNPSRQTGRARARKGAGEARPSVPRCLPGPQAERTRHRLAGFSDNSASAPSRFPRGLSSSASLRGGKVCGQRAGPGSAHPTKTRDLLLRLPYFTARETGVQRKVRTPASCLWCLASKARRVGRWVTSGQPASTARPQGCLFVPRARLLADQAQVTALPSFRGLETSQERLEVVSGTGGW